MFSSGGQFQAAWGGQFEMAKVVTLQRPSVVNFSGFSMVMPERSFSNGKYRYGFNGQEHDRELNPSITTAEFWQYDGRLCRRWNVDPRIEEMPEFSSYSCFGNNPISNQDTEGDLWHIAVGAGVGALIGGGIEAATQLYKSGSVTNWKAVGGAAVQGLVTGGAAAATGGSSLVASTSVKVALVGASAVTANIAGGSANRTIQGQNTTVKNVAVDAAVGLGGAVVGNVAGKAVQTGLDKLSPSVKGKIGELVTQVKYAAQGYKSNGKSVVPTGGTTSTGKVQVAKYDFEMENVITGSKKTVESKFNGSGFTSNQNAALGNVTTPGGVIVDRTTSQQIGGAANGATQSAGTAITNQIEKE